MKQEVIFDYPPMIEEIAKIFPEAMGPGILFSWGTKLYNPSGVPIPPQLIAHEAVHGERQLNGVVAEDQDPVEVWWQVYMTDLNFRFEEELVAHQAEYKVYCGLTKDRERRARYLHQLAVRLSGPLYGRMMPYMQARKRLQGL